MNFFVQMTEQPHYISLNLDDSDAFSDSESDSDTEVIKCDKNYKKIHFHINDNYYLKLSSVRH